MRRLLPPNHTVLEAALADAAALQCPADVLRTLSDSQRCPPALLPWLAWERSVEQFDAAATVEKQRALIHASLTVHKHKGTVAAVRDVFRILGLGEVEIEEGRGGLRRDGTRRRSDYYLRGNRSSHWASYRVLCGSLLTVPQASLARALLADIAPVRCQLHSLDFSRAALVRNGYGRRNGHYTRGRI